jgi:hypothetical protein
MGTTSFETVTAAEWQSQVEAAFVEVDPRNVPNKIHAARIAIFERLEVLSRSSGHISEKEALDDALQGLRFLTTLFD